MGFVLERALRPLRDDEVGFDVAPLERLEHPHTENGAGRTGHADDETPHPVSSAMAAAWTMPHSKRTKIGFVQAIPPLPCPAHAREEGWRIRGRKVKAPRSSILRNGLNRCRKHL